MNSNRLNIYRVLLPYFKIYIFPSFGLKLFLILAFFGTDTFTYNQTIGDFFIEIYYLLLYSFFLIPIVDSFFSIVLVKKSYSDIKILSLNFIKILLLINIAIAVLTLIIAMCIVVLLRFFNLTITI